MSNLDPTCLCTAADRAAGRCKVPCPPHWIPRGRAVTTDLLGRLAQIVVVGTLDPNWQALDVAATLLPVIQAAVREARAEELEAAAGDFACTRDRLLAADRAAAIREQP